jgi:rSAM/selenodomain-associated transferase 1
MQNVLLVVAKKPSPGQTKTRLCPPLNCEQAADLYECFLCDTLAVMRDVPNVTPKIVYLPQDAHDYFRNLAPDMDLVQQRGGSLGERLDNLLTDVLLDGADKAVVMNSDSPTLPKAYLIQAFDQLTATDVVLGPTLDGGYYLIGVKEPQPRILRDVEMSTPYVLRDTLELARKAGITVSLLPEWYDVDTVEELHRLRNDISGLQNNSCACTRAWLQNYPRNGDG